jgi:Na+/melibiose symporter-like transporter
LSASRAQGMAAAGLVFSITSMPMILFFGKHTNKIAGFTVSVAVYTILMILGYWFIFRMTAGRDPYDEAVLGGSNATLGKSVREIVLVVFRNPPLMFLALAQTFSSTGYFLITAVAVYHFTYVVGKPAFLTIFILATSIARLVGTFAAAWIGVKLGKRNSYWIFLALGAAGFAGAKFLSRDPWAFTLVFCVFIMFAAVVSSLNTALFSDTVVYGEWKTGRNIRAFTMALMNLPVKVGVLIRSAIMTVGLMAIGFVANADPTPRVVEGISSIMTLGPAAAYAIAAIIFFFGYKMEDADVVKMQAEIAARK